MQGRTGAGGARLVGVLLACLFAGGCVTMGDSSRPIPQARHPAPVQGDGAAPLVVVLPGRYDDLASLTDSGVVEAIQSQWPRADVLLAAAAMDYYIDGVVADRLHREIVAPARERGVQQLWVVGASLGGMGALLYERAHPGELDGIVLLAPYLGDRAIIGQIMAAGGPCQWQPGPPQTINGSNFETELWRSLRGLADDADRAGRIWLAYGDEDRLRYAIPAIAPLLDPDQVIEVSGGHEWGVWTPAARMLFGQIAD